MLPDLQKYIKEISDQLIAWRRDFHRYPETAFEETRTSAVIREFLESLGLWVETYAKTGLRAVLQGTPGGRTVALRADIDALPMEEGGDKEYISRHPGVTHACAHDGHMAIVMGAAKVLSQIKDRFKGNVAFLFQPSEERIPGGAKQMVEEGALEGVDAVFGLHLWQPLATGKVGLVKGPMMAQPDAFSITIKGAGGHGSMPHQTVDPILVAAQVIVNAQSIVSRNVDPLKPAVVSFGTIEGGTIYNIIPEEVKLTGTVRSFDPAVQELAERRLREITEQTCASLGARAEFQYRLGYPPVVNDPEMVEFVARVAGDCLGADRLIKIDPVMGGEDFSYYLQKIPGAFIFFGMGDGMKYPHHHPFFDMDERALPDATLLMTLLALEYLKQES